MQLSTLNHSFTVGDFLSGGFESLSGIAELMKADPALIEGLKTAGLIGDGLSGNWLGPVVGGFAGGGGNLVAPATKTIGDLLQAATKAATKVTKVSAGGCIVAGIADSYGTYYARKEAYGQQTATQDGIAHGLITASGGVIGAATGAAAGAFVGSIVPGLGTIVGAGIGLGVGYLGTVVGSAVYDNSVNRGNGDGFQGHIKDNLW